MTPPFLRAIIWVLPKEIAETPLSASAGTFVHDPPPQTTTRPEVVKTEELTRFPAPNEIAETPGVVAAAGMAPGVAPHCRRTGGVGAGVGLGVGVGTGVGAGVAEGSAITLAFGLPRPVQ